MLVFLMRCISVIYSTLFPIFLWLDFTIGGRIINKVRIVNDTVIIVKTQEDLQDMVNRCGFMA